MDYLRPHTDRELQLGMSSLALAHIGDGVYELLVRTWLCLQGKATSAGLHRACVAQVSAGAQADAMQKIMPLLTEEELDTFRRGRNANPSLGRHRSNPEEYHAATGLEALFGSLYLQGRTERINELFLRIMGE